MASEKTTRSDDKTTDRDCEATLRGGADGKSKTLSDRASDNGHSQAQPSADELGRRAWETTYRNRHKGHRD
jgi:hypothetical protein